jgi:hypothetical protein
MDNVLIVSPFLLSSAFLVGMSELFPFAFFNPAHKTADFPGARIGPKHSVQRVGKPQILFLFTRQCHSVSGHHAAVLCGPKF